MGAAQQSLVRSSDAKTRWDGKNLQVHLEATRAGQGRRKAVLDAGQLAGGPKRNTPAASGRVLHLPLLELERCSCPVPARRTFVGYLSFLNVRSSLSKMKCSLRKSKEMMGPASCKWTLDIHKWGTVSALQMLAAWGACMGSIGSTGCKQPSKNNCLGPSIAPGRMGSCPELAPGCRTPPSGCRPPPELAPGCHPPPCGAPFPALPSTSPSACRAAPLFPWCPQTRGGPPAGVWGGSEVRHVGTLPSTALHSPPQVPPQASSAAPFQRLGTLRRRQPYSMLPQHACTAC